MEQSSRHAMARQYSAKNLDLTLASLLNAVKTAIAELRELAESASDPRWASPSATDGRQGAAIKETAWLQQRFTCAELRPARQKGHGQERRGKLPIITGTDHEMALVLPREQVHFPREYCRCSSTQRAPQTWAAEFPNETFGTTGQPAGIRLPRRYPTSGAAPSPGEHPTHSRNEAASASWDPRQPCHRTRR